MSGPAAGVLGGAWAAEHSGRRRLITFDVGGTSADIGIVIDGHYNEATARDTWIGGYPVLVPMIDITTIGAGGGSIARIDAGGAFKVGPESAGSEPGPACYGRGGSAPTVTDANIVLGRLDADNFLGGEMTLAPERADKALTDLGGDTRHRQARGRRRVCSPSSTPTWRTPSAPRRCRRDWTHANSRWSPSAAPARCMAPRSRRCSTYPRFWCRLIPASRRRRACSPPTSSTTRS